MKDDVGITIATHGWIGTEITRGKFMMDEGADMQWKEEREVRFSSLVEMKFSVCSNTLLLFAKFHAFLFKAAKKDMSDLFDA